MASLIYRGQHAIHVVEHGYVDVDVVFEVTEQQAARLLTIPGMQRHARRSIASTRTSLKKSKRKKEGTG
jgi:hypothetical protein